MQCNIRKTYDRFHRKLNFYFQFKGFLIYKIMSDNSPPTKLRKFAVDELSALDKEELIENIDIQRKYVEGLESKLKAQGNLIYYQSFF